MWIRMKERFQGLFFFFGYLQNLRNIGLGSKIEIFSKGRKYELPYFSYIGYL